MAMDYKYLKNIIKYVLTVLLSVGLAAYILYHMINSLNDSVETIPVSFVTQEDCISVDGYLFRSETLLYTTQPGSVSVLFDNGTHVRAGSAVCQVYSGSESDSDAAKLAEIDRKIALLKKSNMDDGITYSDTQIIDASINNLYYTILQKIHDGDIGYVLRKKDDLIASMNTRQIITKHVTDYSEQIAALENERNLLIQKTGEVTETIHAPEAGYYYATIDGFENTFSSDKIAGMTLDMFDQLTASTADLSLEVSGSGVNAGKIVTDYIWYVGCIVSEDEARAYDEGDSYTLIFPYNSDKRITAELSRIVMQADDSRVLLIFETRAAPENFNYLRRQNVQIVQQTYNGFRVPLSAVRIVDGEQGVYVLHGYTVVFKKITPLLEVNGYFIVADDEDAELKLYDSIITKGKNLYAGKIIS